MKYQYRQNNLFSSLQGRGLGVGLLLLASLILGSCGDDDIDDNTQAKYTETVISQAPVWQVDWSNNQERPNWAAPNSRDYAYETNMKLKLEDALQPYASEGDMLAVFVNNELRGLANGPVTIVKTGQKENGKFMFKVFGNETGTETVNISLQYYSQTLKHLFTLTQDITLDPDVEIGFETEYIPPFTYGSAKYPVWKEVTAESLLNKVDITPISGNTVAAFVGEECRGTVSLSASGSTKLLIVGRTAGESITLKYYDAAAGKLYIIPNAVKL